MIAISSGDFPTDRYVVDGIARARGLQVRDDFDDLDDVAVMVRSVVDYRTAAVADVAGETARATAAGAIALWDLSHAAGVVASRPRCRRRAAGRRVHVQVPQRRTGLAGVQLRRPSICRRRCRSRSGAGSPRPSSSRWARRSHRSPTSAGCCSARRRSSLSPPPRRASPSTVDAGIEAIAAKAATLTGFALGPVRPARRCSRRHRRDPARRGGHVAVHHPDARRLVTELAGRGVITDFRDPDIVRIGCSPLTTRFTDVFDGLTALAALADVVIV